MIGIVIINGMNIDDINGIEINIISAKNIDDINDSEINIFSTKNIDDINGIEIKIIGAKNIDDTNVIEIDIISAKNHLPSHPQCFDSGCRQLCRLQSIWGEYSIAEYLRKIFYCRIYEENILLQSIWGWYLIISN